MTLANASADPKSGPDQPGAGSTPEPTAPSLWRNGDFLKLWGAQSFGQLGAEVAVLAMPLTAVLLLHATPFQVGLVIAAEFLPFLIVGLPAGVWVDRRRRRNVMLLANFGRAGVLLLIPVAYLLGVLNIWLLCGVIFLTGILTVFFDVAYQSYLRTLVRPDQMVDGNAKLEFSNSAGELLGPSIGGFAIQLVGPVVAVLVNTGGYLASGLSLLAIRKREEAPAEDASADQGLVAEIRAGVRFVFGHQYLRAIAACTALTNLFGFGGAVQAILVIYATGPLDMSAGALGLALAIGNGAALVAAAAGNRLLVRLGLGRVMIGAIVLTTGGALFLPMATPSTAMVVVAVVAGLHGVGATVYNICQISLRQCLTPPRMQGRMNATMRFAVWGTIPIGALLGGTLATFLGIRPTLWLVGVVSLLSWLPLALSPIRSLRRMPEPAVDVP
ncbi:MFS transporter [Streptomyces sp. NPDC059076]|uniref:MFS transporter n=1 Tax=unclassified Streptomyces TaxID=2593676 RepID=UPI0036BBC094